MSRDRNIEFAQTLPDCDRRSYVRVREHAHPLSTDLNRLAESVDVQAKEISDALESSSAARLLQAVEALVSSQRLLAKQLRAHAKTAATHENELTEKMRMLRDVLEARHT